MVVKNRGIVYTAFRCWSGRPDLLHRLVCRILAQNQVEHARQIVVLVEMDSEFALGGFAFTQVNAYIRLKVSSEPILDGP